jgi:hypothetical protein
MRLIDADELKEAMEEHTDYKGYLVCDPEEIIDLVPTVERPHEKWEYLKEHITEMRDADGELNQKQTCQFILELMGVIEREGDRNEQTTD